MVQRETVMAIPQKLNIDSPCDPAIPLLGICPKELKAGAQTGVCTLVFTETLFTMAKKKEAILLLSNQVIIIADIY